MHRHPQYALKSIVGTVSVLLDQNIPYLYVFSTAMAVLYWFDSFFESSIDFGHFLLVYGR